MARENVSLNELFDVARRALDMDELTGREKALLWAVTKAVTAHASPDSPTATVDLDVDDTIQEYGRVPTHDLIAQFKTSFALGLPFPDKPGPEDQGKITGIIGKATLSAQKITKKPPKPKPEPKPDPDASPSEPAPDGPEG
jgi:hypothetical protein